MSQERAMASRSVASLARQLRAMEKVRRIGSQTAGESAGPQAAVQGLLVPLVDRQDGLELAAGDLPDGVLVAMGVAMGGQQAVHELEQVPRHPQGAQSVFEPLLIDRRVEQIGQRRRGARRLAQAASRALARS